MELATLKKNKVNLSDYDWEADAKRRILMSDFSVQDIDVLEEILYSPLKVYPSKLAKNLELDPQSVLTSIEKLEKIGLLQKELDYLLVDKDMRKYFEFEIERFQPGFRPDMEFLQGLLKKLPIHILPMWYQIPRSSNNIFSSIIEKYLYTPQIYQRYIEDLNVTDEIAKSIIEELFSSKELKINSSDLIAKHNLSRIEFEKIILYLEFHFVCSLSYERQDEHFEEYITPFYEWGEHLKFLEKTTPTSIDNELVKKDPSKEFVRIEEMAHFLQKVIKEPQLMSSHWICQRLLFSHLVEKKGNQIHPNASSYEWLDSDLEDKAIYLHRFSSKKLLNVSDCDRMVKEAEKSIKRVINSGWVFYNEFENGVIVPFKEEETITLMKNGKKWSYRLPEYSDEEKKIIKETIFDWLYTLGIVDIGTYEGKECFRLSSFGRFFFSE